MQRENQISISVVLPSYSGMPLFKKALESVLNQQDVSFELLVGNDNPLDVETKAYLDSIEQSSLRVFHNPENLGLFANLNNLIRNARGELIHLWSQDDIMNVNCLAETVKFHEEHPNIAYAFCRVEVIDENGEIIDRMPINANDTMSTLTHDLTSILTGSVPGNIANVSIRKTVFERYGYFREDLKYSGDFEYWCRITDTLPVGIIQKHLIQLRRHTGQLSRNPKMWIYRIQENDEIMKKFMARVPEEKRKYLQRGLSWRVYNQYFGLYLNLLRSGNYEVAQGFLTVIKKYGSIHGYCFRYGFLKILSVFNKDRKFLNWLYYKKAFA